MGRRRRDPRLPRAAAVLICAGALAVAVLPPDLALAAPGDVDQDYAGGFTEYSFTGAEVVRSGRFEPDGSIVVTGASQETGDRAFFVGRFTSSGTPDPSFGTSGYVTTVWGETAGNEIFYYADAVAAASATQPDGKVVVVGYQGGRSGPDYDVALARYNADGTLDSGFGTDGKVTVPFDGSAYGTSVLLQPDGGVLVGGTYTEATSTWDLANHPYHGILIRLSETGAPDPTFGTDGIVIDPTERSDLVLQSVRPDGGILTQRRLTTSGALVRYNADGSVDSSFGSGGSTPCTLELTCNPPLVDAQGRRVFFGRTYHPNSAPQFTAVRMNADDTYDTTFGTNGVFESQFAPGPDGCGGVAADAAFVGQQIVLAGSWCKDVAVVRLQPDGTLDTGFGTGGLARSFSTDGHSKTVDKVRVRDDGSTTIVGTSWDPANQSPQFHTVLGAFEGGPGAPWPPPPPPPPPAPPQPAVQSTNPAEPASGPGGGYAILTDVGALYTFGNARYFGNLIDHGYAGRAVSLAYTPTGNGYTILTDAGAIYSFGDARYYGNLIDHRYPGRAVSLAYTPTGNGYTILTDAGAIYSFGDARYFGNLIDHGYPGRAVALGYTPDGNGYSILTEAGAIYSFGNARYFGNLIDHGYPGPAVSLAYSIDGAGYSILTQMGAMYSFGNAVYYGNLIDHGYPGPAVSMSMTPE